MTQPVNTENTQMVFGAGNTHLCIVELEYLRTRKKLVPVHNVEVIQLVMKIDVRIVLAQTRNETEAFGISVVGHAQIDIEVVAQAGLGIEPGDAPAFYQNRLDTG